MANSFIPIAIQQKLLEKAFPDSICKINPQKHSELIWTSYLRPTPLSSMYKVRMIYEFRKSPNVFVLDPKPLRRPLGESVLKHVYDTPKQHLCLYYKRAKEWNPSQSLVDVVPWIAEWLFYYELWVLTGKWLGGGIHVENKII